MNMKYISPQAWDSTLEHSSIQFLIKLCSWNNEPYYIEYISFNEAFHKHNIDVLGWCDSICNVCEKHMSISHSEEKTPCKVWYWCNTLVSHHKVLVPLNSLGFVMV